MDGDISKLLIIMTFKDSKRFLRMVVDSNMAEGRSAK